MPEERGKLSTDDPLKKYIPNAPDAWDQITIYNLLTYTSGIPDFGGLPGFQSSKATHITPEEHMARIRERPLDFRPWDKKKLSGQSYQDFVAQNIFKPLVMDDSGYDSQSAIILRRASGYSLTQSALVNSSYLVMSVPYAAGGLYSTTGDMLRWEKGLFSGKLLAEPSLKKMTTPFKGGYAC